MAYENTGLDDRVSLQSSPQRCQVKICQREFTPQSFTSLFHLHKRSSTSSAKRRTSAIARYCQVESACISMVRGTSPRTTAGSAQSPMLECSWPCVGHSRSVVHFVTSGISTTTCENTITLFQGCGAHISLTFVYISHFLSGIFCLCALAHIILLSR